MPDLFLSYSRDDTLTMSIIRDNLRKLGFNLWIDVEHLKAGTPQWERAVKRAVADTDGLLVLCSPSAEKSEWVNREVAMARLAHKPAVPILIAGEVWDAIPAGLMGDQYCDMRGRSGPEQGFRELVTVLVERFQFDVPDYDLRSFGSMQIPAVQVINIQGHVEGHVITIGGDVGGDVVAAGREFRQQVTAPVSREVISVESAPSVPDVVAPGKQPTRSRGRRWIIGAGMGAVMLIMAVVFADDIWRLVTEAAESEENTPTDPSGLTPVRHNADWTPRIETINGVEMALVPAGCFEMGSVQGYNHEQPVHTVCFDEPFWIDVYEVTNAQFGSSGGWSGDDLPREYVDWYEAIAHCERREARLPTEAEWEYAARGPDGLVYPWGNEFTADNVVYLANSGNQTWPVGSRPEGASWVGAVDLSGNVWEWVNDWYDVAYYGSLAEGVINPQGPESGTDHVMRGGSWVEDTGFVRAAIRVHNPPDNASSVSGFRCALTYQP